MKLYKLILFAAGMWITAPLCAQQSPEYSLQTFNPYGFNPAYAGMEYSLSITGLTRRQWNEIDRSPSTQQLNAHLPLYIAHGAAGIKFENEHLGSRRNLKFTLSYNYVETFDWGILSGGAGAGFYQMTIDGTELRARDGNYEGNVIDHQDPLLPNTKESDILPTAELGLYAVTNSVEGGFSITNISTGEFSIATPDGELRYKAKPVIHLFGKYSLPLEADWELRPAVYAHSDGIETQVTALVEARYQGRISGSMGWRGYNKNTFDALILSAGYKLNEHFDLYYAYDIGLSALAERSSGTHELVLKYNLNKKIGAGTLPKIIYNPRFL